MHSWRRNLFLHINTCRHKCHAQREIYTQRDTHTHRHPHTCTDALRRTHMPNADMHAHTACPPVCFPSAVFLPAAHTPSAVPSPALGQRPAHQGKPAGWQGWLPLLSVLCGASLPNPWILMAGGLSGREGSDLLQGLRERRLSHLGRIMWNKECRAPSSGLVAQQVLRKG